MIALAALLSVNFTACKGVLGDESIGRTLTGDEIRAELVGNSYRGRLDNGTAYMEYLHPGGRVRAEGYFGRWTISGDTLCFDYDRGTADDGCWGVALSGNEITWLTGGKADGTATLIAGNPNNL